MIDLDAPLVDAQHVFTATQTAIVSRAIQKLDDATGDSFHVIIEKNFPDAQEDAINTYENMGPEHPLYIQNLVIDVATKEVGFKTLAGIPNIAENNNTYDENKVDLEVAQAMQNRLRANHGNIAEAIADVIPYAYVQEKKIIGQNIQKNNEKKVSNAIFWKNFEIFWHGALLLGISLVLILFGMLPFLNHKWRENIHGNNSLMANKLKENEVYNFFRNKLNLEIVRFIPYANSATEVWEKLLENIIEIRTILRKEKRTDLWGNIFEELAARIDDINERIKICREHSENSSKEDAEDMRDFLRNEVYTLRSDIEKLKSSLKPRMDESVKAKIMKSAYKNKNIDGLVNERIESIKRKIDFAVENLPQDMSDEAFTIAETKNRYIPDTIKKYIEAKEVNTKEADKLFNQQLDIIEDGANKTLLAIQEGKLDNLKANGLFLKERLSK